MNSIDDYMSNVIASYLDGKTKLSGKIKIEKPLYLNDFEIITAQSHKL